MQTDEHKEVRVQEEERLSLREAAEALGISEVTARRWIKSGKLKAAQPGRKYLIPRSAVEDLLRADSPKAPPSEWEEALGEARQLQAEGRDRMEALLVAWRESRDRGEEKAERREYLDEIGNLLQEAYDAESALMKAGHHDPWVEVFKANNLYSTLLHMVGDAGLSIHIRSSGETGQRVHSVDPVAA